MYIHKVRYIHNRVSSSSFAALYLTAYNIKDDSSWNANYHCLSRPAQPPHKMQEEEVVAGSGGM